MSSRFVVLVSLVAACSERNPAFCGDGICIDPARPFCDRDGAFGGVPDTCIAVSCTPSSFEACRGDVAITCNTTGTNFDETQCPLGCDAAANGCKQCLDNDQCNATSPICDPAGTCRACETDDECNSRVCDRATGQCALESTIVYAAADSTFGSCSLSQPCPLTDAITLAINTTPTPILRMLPGVYASSVDVSVATPTPLAIVATGATVVMIGDVW